MHNPQKVVISTNLLRYILLVAVSTAFFCLFAYNFMKNSQTDTLVENFVDKELPTLEIVYTNRTKKPESLKESQYKLLMKTRAEKSPFITTQTCKQKKNVSYEILCKLNLTSFCNSVQPAEALPYLWVIAPIYSFNQEKTPLLYQLHYNFRDYCQSIGMSFCAIEGIKEDLKQPYIATRPNNEPYEMQVKLYDEDYIRENLLNVAIRKLPDDWEYVAWIDAHQVFTNSYWWEESIVKMEKNASVQLFQTVSRLNARNQTMYRKKAVIYSTLLVTDIDNCWWLEYGNAYGITKDLYRQIGTIMDICIATGCDLSYVKASIPIDTRFSLLYYQHAYAPQFEPWINHTRSVFKDSRAAVRGEIVHLEHEHYINYDIVPKAFAQEGFNVTTDIARDKDFVIYLTNKKLKQILTRLRLKFFITP